MQIQCAERESVPYAVHHKVFALGRVSIVYDMGMCVSVCVCVDEFSSLCLYVGVGALVCVCIFPCVVV